MIYTDFLLYLPKTKKAHLDESLLKPKSFLKYKKKFKFKNNTLITFSKSEKANYLESKNFTMFIFGMLFSYKNETEKPETKILEDLENNSLDENRLNGQFIILVYNKKNNKFKVITDYLGMIHAYIIKEKDYIVISSDYYCISRLKKNKELDWNALSAYFSFGFFLDKYTFFKDIEIILPAISMEVKNSSISSRKYWRLQYKPNSSLTKNEILSTLKRKLENATRIRKNKISSGCIPISGGMDSRTLAALLDNKKYQAYTYGYSKDSEEIELGRKIAYALRFNWKGYVIPKNLNERLPDIVRTMEGFYPCHHARQGLVIENISKEKEGVFVGHGGEFLGSILAKEDIEKLRGLSSEKLFNKLKIKNHNWLLKNLCCKKVKGNPEENTKVLLESLLNKIPEENNFAKFLVFRVEEYNFRFNHPGLKVFQQGFFPICILCDKDVVEFLFTLKKGYLLDRKVHVELLKKYYPKIARIKWDKYGLNLYNLSYFKNRLFPLLVFKNWKERLREIFKGKRVQTNWEQQYLSSRGKELMRNWLLNNNRKIIKFIEINKLKEVVKKFYKSPEEWANVISLLITFSAWLEIYYDK